MGQFLEWHLVLNSLRCQTCMRAVRGWIHSDSYQKDTMGTLAPHMIKVKSAHSRLATLLLMMMEQTIGHCIWIGLLEFTHQRRHISSLLAMVVTDMERRPLPVVHMV